MEAWLIFRILLWQLRRKEVRESALFKIKGINDLRENESFKTLETFQSYLSRNFHQKL